MNRLKTLQMLLYFDDWANLHCKKCRKKWQTYLNDSFATPDHILEDNEIRPNLDVCATAINSKAPEFITESENALNRTWIGRHKNNTIVWCNPPHSQNKEFVRKAYNEHLATGVKIFMLIPLNTLSTNYAFRYIHDQDFTSIKFIKGRIKFLDPLTNKTSLHPSRNGYVLVTFKRSKDLNIDSYIN